MEKWNENRIKMGISLRPHIKKMLEEYAEQVGIPKSNVIALAVEKYIREELNRDKK